MPFKSLIEDDTYREVGYLTTEQGCKFRIESRKGPSQFDGRDVDVVEAKQKTQVVENAGGTDNGEATRYCSAQVKFSGSTESAEWISSKEYRFFKPLDSTTTETPKEGQHKEVDNATAETMPHRDQEEEDKGMSAAEAAKEEQEK